MEGKLVRKGGRGSAWREGQLVRKDGMDGGGECQGDGDNFPPNITSGGHDTHTKCL